MGTGLSGYQVRHKVPQGGRWECCRQMAAIFVSVVHSGQSESSSLPACLLCCVFDKIRTNEIATQIQGWICRWDQQYFLLRLWLFYRHQLAKEPKVFMKFIAWTIKIAWVWAEWLRMKNSELLWGKGSSPNNLILGFNYTHSSIAPWLTFPQHLPFSQAGHTRATCWQISGNNWHRTNSFLLRGGLPIENNTS